VVEAHGGKGERGREEAAEEEDTKERARYAWVPAIAGMLLGRSGAEERDQSPFGPILAPVTSSMTQMTWIYKF